MLGDNISIDLSPCIEADKAKEKREKEKKIISRAQNTSTL